jgi:uncharacterized protein YkwD
MKKFLFLILLLAVAAGTVIFFRDDLALLYSKIFTKFPQIEKNIGAVVQEAQKQIFTPAPLKALTGQKGAILTKEGVISYTNQQRAGYGLPALKESPNLDASAAVKARDMFANQYFEHTSPSGIGVKDLAENAGYEFIIIGENLAMGNFESDQALVDAWMNSPGHRENILNPNYTDIGVWVEKGTFEGKTTWMAVQHFGEPLSACPQPKEALKNQIDTNKNQIDQLKISLDSLEQELQSLRGDRQTYNQKVQEYNDFVSQYNNLISQTKALVNQYNSQVNSFNDCVSAGK